jgi:hypothetical protein
MPTLILPPRITPDTDAMLEAAQAAGWEAQRLDSWRVPADLDREDVTLYGEPLFADVVAPSLGVALLQAPFDWLPGLPERYRQREVMFDDLPDESIEMVMAGKQAFGDVPRPVRAVAVGEVPGVWDLAAGEQVDDCSLVAKRVAELSVAQSYDVFVADPRAADPAGLWNKAPGCWQTSGRQRPQQRRIGSRLVDERC